MRLCLVETTGSEDTITVVGSEPYLAQASLELISEAGVNPVRYLEENWDLNCVDLANRRWVFVNEFMEALLPASAYDALRTRHPFEMAFEGYCLWFNHVIKVRNSDKISVKSLWEFITRAILIQVKNDKSFQCDISGHLFDGMEPFHVKLFPAATRLFRLFEWSSRWPPTMLGC
ncbi:hypothetical protein B0F90DRAFT_1775703 [Multifurca ochricompacta]|uniref:Uncharacterized protein n=1 Tax=Multifurca ochricompacta TaxID=376703 RepID=A0AAD4LVY2_9AGAM|nr:hypothetical protein B0F90DRAFT_1775703 [Multifurca ochricompacta]